MKNNVIDQEFKIEDIYCAFRKLKRLVYYDKSNLSLRRSLATFENNVGFKSNLGAVKDVLNSKNSVEHPVFIQWLEKITFFVTAKKLEKLDLAQNKSSTFITNLTTANSYKVEKVNYFFDGPIELQLIAVLWIMREGHFLDKSLGRECYGARLEERVGSPGDQSAELYCKYHELYKRWRDQGIRKAKDMLTNEHTSICILGLDVQEYYYNAALDYDEIALAIEHERCRVKEISFSKTKTNQSQILSMLQRMALQFSSTIKDSLYITHPNVQKTSIGLPIGLVSSPLLADWFLGAFDKSIKEEVQPSYYGRYVDDIFLVTQAPASLSSDSPVDEFIRGLMVKTGVLQDSGSASYEIISRPGLFLQKDKCILQHFDVQHSIAGLEKFQKKLESNASNFLLMPVDEDESSLEEVAYELLYDGSVNKFRSVKGVAENRYELAKYLSHQTMLHLLTDDPPNSTCSSSLLSFFKGKNAIEFNDAWEKVFTYFEVSKDAGGFQKFKNALLVEISRTIHENDTITQLLRSHLKRHLQLSANLALSLGSTNLFNNPDARAFRKSNLIRHHLVRFPLLNFTDYAESLTENTVTPGIKLSTKKMERSPRFVNFDECMLFINHGKLKQFDKEYSNEEKFQAAKQIFNYINHIEFKGVKWTSNVAPRSPNDE